jgi:hypothetical protein
MLAFRGILLVRRETINAVHGCTQLELEKPQLISLLVWLITHQPAVLFSHTKPGISNLPTVLFS